MEADEYDRMDAVEAEMWWYRALHARLLDALRMARGRVLDAGCGTGGFLAVLRRRRPDLEAFGVEWAEAAARRAADKSQARIVRGSVNALPFADASFDHVISADVLCHTAVQPGAALAEMRRVLRPAGCLVVNMPAYAWLLSAHDRRVHNARRQNAEELRATLQAAGFPGPRTRYWNAFLLPVMVAQRKLRPQADRPSDVTSFPAWLDAALHATCEMERRLGLPMPAGGSVMAVAAKD